MNVKMKIVLVKPPSSDNVHPAKGTIRIPISLAYLAAVCEHAGHEVVIIDGELVDGGIESIVRSIAAESPNLVGITGTTVLFPIVSRMTKDLHEIDKTIKVILGGPHVSAMPVESIKVSGADYICIGEGEEVLVRLLNAVSQSKEPDNIQGLLYLWSNALRGSTTPAKIADLDLFPFPARHLLDLKAYYDLPRGISTPQDALVSSRGCSYRCAFCASAGTGVRFRSIDHIMSELDEIVFKYGTRNIIMMDDTFTINKERVNAFCKRVIEGEYNITFNMQTRLNTIDPWILEMGIKAGCDSVCLGIESGNQRILDDIGKKITLDLIREKVKIVKEVGVTFRATYIIGWLDETEQEILNTIEFAREVDAHESAFCIATPFPGTRLWNDVIKKGLNPGNLDYSKLHYYFDLGINLSNVATGRLLELQQQAHKAVNQRIYKE